MDHSHRRSIVERLFYEPLRISTLSNSELNTRHRTRTVNEGEIFECSGRSSIAGHDDGKGWDFDAVDNPKIRNRSHENPPCKRFLPGFGKQTLRLRIG